MAANEVLVDLASFERSNASSKTKRKALKKKPRRKIRQFSLPDHESLSVGFSSTVSSRIPEFSTAFNPKNLKKEAEWDSRFHVKFSKGNSIFHKTLREYFDSPRKQYKDSGLQPDFSKTLNWKQEKRGRRPNLMRQTVSPNREWKRTFSPISEINLTKYNARRTFFDSIKHFKLEN